MSLNHPDFISKKGDMELSVSERLVLLSVLPNEANYLTLKIVRELKETLSFTEEEHKTYKFSQEGNVIRWDDTGQTRKDITIGEKATDIVRDAFKKLDNHGKLREEHISLYERFVKDAT